MRIQMTKPAFSLTKHRIVAAWLLWACAMMSNAVIGVLLQRYTDHSSRPSSPPLRDFGFDLLPYIPSKSLGFSIPDLCALGSATMIAFNIVLQFRPAFATILLRRILFISAIAYFGRTLSVPMTLLPNPDTECVPTVGRTTSVLLSIILVPFGATVTCSDVFYSGHTIPITCAILTWMDYLTLRRHIRFLGITVSSLALVGIIVTHFHYTVDVVYAVVVTTVVWKLYHLALTCPSIFFHYPLVQWWESSDAIGSLTTVLPGVFPIQWSRDPRLTWSFKEKPNIEPDRKGLSRSQLLLLTIVALTLSPSWIAIYQGATSLT